MELVLIYFEEKHRQLGKRKAKGLDFYLYVNFLLCISTSPLHLSHDKILLAPLPPQEYSAPPPMHKDSLSPSSSPLSHHIFLLLHYPSISVTF